MENIENRNVLSVTDEIQTSTVKLRPVVEPWYQGDSGLTTKKTF